MKNETSHLLLPRQYFNINKLSVYTHYLVFLHASNFYQGAERGMTSHPAVPIWAQHTSGIGAAGHGAGTEELNFLERPTPLCASEA